MSTLPSMSKESLHQLQRADDVIGCVWKYWESGSPPSTSQLLNEPRHVRKLLQLWPQLVEHDGVLYRHIQLGNQQVKQLLLPDCLRQEVLHSLHDQAGHQSPAKTLHLAQTRCYWIGMSTDIDNYCRQMHTCEGRKEMPNYNGYTTSKETIGCSSHGFHVTGTRNQSCGERSGYD